MTYRTRDVDETFESIDALLRHSKEWARGEYLVWASGEQGERKAGYLEVTDEGTKWYSRDDSYTYVPPTHTHAASPPKVFAMYNPTQVREGLWRLERRGRGCDSAANYIMNRAKKAGYKLTGVEAQDLVSSGIVYEESVWALGSAKLTVVVDRRRIGGPNVTIDHEVVR